MLDSAKAFALKLGDPVLGPGQYLYVRSHEYGVSQMVDPRRAVDVFSQSIQQSWIPAAARGTTYYRSEINIGVRFRSAGDRLFVQQNAPGGIPTHEVDWSVRTGNGPEVQVYPPVQDTPTAVCRTPICPLPSTAWDSPTVQSLAGLPRDPVALRASLYRYAAAQQATSNNPDKLTSVDGFAFLGVSTVLASGIVPSDLRVALYQVAKTIPGVTLVGSIANYDGERGVAIGRVDGFGIEQELIFDVAGGSYIGSRTITTRPNEQYNVPSGTLLSSTAIHVGIAGQPALPAGASTPR